MDPILRNKDAQLLVIIRQEFIRIAADTTRLPTYRGACRDILIPELNRLIAEAETRHTTTP